MRSTTPRSSRQGAPLAIDDLRPSYRIRSRADRHSELSRSDFVHWPIRTFRGNVGPLSLSARSGHEPTCQIGHIGREDPKRKSSAPRSSQYNVWGAAGVPGAPAIVFLAEGRHGPDAGEYGEKISVTLVRRCECERPRLWGPTHGRLSPPKVYCEGFYKGSNWSKAAWRNKLRIPRRNA
jgi:hypothetical protein